MKSIIKFSLPLIMVFCFFFTGNVWSQNINGTAHYKSHRKLTDFSMNNQQMDDAQKAQMQAMLEKQFQKEYKLDFNSHESVFQEEKTLDSGPASFQSGGMEMVFTVSGGSDILYRNLSENRYTNQNDFHGKIFLIRDELKKPEWVLSNETKSIGEYVCFKASYDYTVTKTVVNSDNGNEETETVEEIQTVTAWYTPQIPLGHGPENYWGLPGLILEISDGNYSLLCTKIVLNNKDAVDISEPKKGTKITREKYEKVVKEKNDELNEKFQNNRKGDGNTIEFRIGG